VNVKLTILILKDYKRERKRERVREREREREGGRYGSVSTLIIRQA